MLPLGYRRNSLCLVTGVTSFPIWKFVRHLEKRSNILNDSLHLKNKIKGNKIFRENNLYFIFCPKSLSASVI